MGATTVTGKGPGSANGLNKGAADRTLGVSHLIGPRVVAAGVETLTSTTGTVEIPPQSGVYTDYIIMLQQRDSATCAYHGGMLSTWSFLITAASSAVVEWTVIKKGF